jgi:putative hydrolase of the HAD superfamily
VPKPDESAYLRFFDRHGVDPARSAMFEDLVKNLAVPHATGMTTVLVVPPDLAADPREPWERHQPVDSHIDWVTDDIARFLAADALAKAAGPMP